MYPYIEIGNISISSYIFMAIVAFVVSTIAVVFRARSQKISFVDILLLSLIVMLGGTFTAKLFYFVGVAILEGQEVWTSQYWENISFTTGFVWYGGVIGAIVFTIIYAKLRSLPLKNVMDSMTPFALIFDGIARFGCLFVGCCYGKESTWGLNYNGVLRLPSPMFESVLCFIILTQVIIWKPERKYSGILLPLYLASYSLGRFVLEFFRGDARRGFFMSLSSSQWISLLLITVVFTWFCTQCLRQRRKQPLTLL